MGSNAAWNRSLRGILTQATGPPLARVDLEDNRTPRGPAGGDAATATGTVQRRDTDKTADGIGDDTRGQSESGIQMTDPIQPQGHVRVDVYDISEPNADEDLPSDWSGDEESPANDPAPEIANNEPDIIVSLLIVCLLIY